MPWENSLQELQRVRAEGVKRVKGAAPSGLFALGRRNPLLPFPLSTLEPVGAGLHPAVVVYNCASRVRCLIVTKWPGYDFS